MMGVLYFVTYSLGIASADNDDYEKIVPRFVTLLKNEALSCKQCGSLAIPIYNTSNKYRCINCSNQFSGSPHHIADRIEQNLPDYNRKGQPGKEYNSAKVYNLCINRINPTARYY